MNITKLIQLYYPKIPEQSIKGFTLAEVLVTIGIIGLVASMTLPTLVNNYQEKALLNQLKVGYSRLDSGIKLMTEDLGTIDFWGETPEARRLYAFEHLPEYIQVTQVCKKKTKGCQGRIYKTLSSSTVGGDTKAYFDGNYDSILLANGMSIQLSDGRNCSQTVAEWRKADNLNKADYQNICFSLDIDVNGPKNPNTSSLDRFTFLVLRDGIVPAGTASSNRWSWVLSFNSGCIGTPFGVAYAANCTAWVLTHENMDYRRCKEKLGWEANKQKSCK